MPVAHEFSDDPVFLKRTIVLLLGDISELQDHLDTALDLQKRQNEEIERLMALVQRRSLCVPSLN